MPCCSLNLLYFEFTCINATVEEPFKRKSLYLTYSLCTSGSSRNSNIFERRMTDFQKVCVQQDATRLQWHFLKNLLWKHRTYPLAKRLRFHVLLFPWYSFVLLHLNSSIFALRMKRKRDILWMTHKSSHKTTLNLHAFHLMDAPE